MLPLPLPVPTTSGDGAELSGSRSVWCFAGIVGTAQAIETIKILLDIGEPLIGHLLLFSALAMDFKKMKLRADSQCPVCGENPTIHELIDYEEFCQVHW